MLTAIRDADLASLRALVAAGSSLAATDEDAERPPLHAAIEAATGAPGDPMLAVVQLLVELGADVNLIPSQYAASPLFEAAHRGADAITRWLVAQGARLDAVDFEGHTILHGAAMGGLAWLAEQCLAAGMDPDGGTHNGQRPIHLVFGLGSRDWRPVATLLERAGARLDANEDAGGGPLHCAALHVRPDALPWLVERGLGIDAPAASADGYTPLMMSAQWRRPDPGLATMRGLLALGADVHRATAVTGLTALHCAAWSRDLPRLELLLEARADRTAKTRSAGQITSTRFKAGATPAHLARLARWPEGAAHLA